MIQFSSALQTAQSTYCYDAINNEQRPLRDDYVADISVYSTDWLGHYDLGC